ncbi:MAG: cysteine synthase [Candidatus Rokubacteria bacterium]|nr:cysteine synthase [Candidatus Rokubacteria bacterium]
MTANTILSAIGRTPLVRLAAIPRDVPGAEIYAKVEWLNPGGSVKDRPAHRMVLAGEQSGALRPGKIILDATSGNTGIALAMIGAARGYPVRLCLPANATEERKKILAAYGADLLLTDALEMTDGAIRTARALAAADPQRYFYADQYNNPANWQAHYETTAPEIWAQTGGRITHFIAGLGTGGTFVGTARRLIEFNPSIQLIEFQPDRPLHGIEGLKHMPSSLLPGIYDPTLADESLAIATEDAYEMAARLAREEGLFGGISSGAAVAAALAVARRIGAGVIVTVLPDGGGKYLGADLFRSG